MEGDECLRLELDEFIQLLIVLIGNCIDTFGSYLKNKIGCVIIERVCSLDVVSNDVTN